MRTSRLVAALLSVLAAASAAVAAGCGEEEGHQVVEGEPIELDELSYNVQLTRFLNPDDNEDAEYLTGKPPPPPGEAYLGVFLVIENESEDHLASATRYEVVDTLGERYDPLPTESPYALELGATVPPDEQLPLPDTTAATGPIQGAMLLFLVDDSVSENRPLELEIGSESEPAKVVLDI